MYSCKLQDISSEYTQIEIFEWLEENIGKSPVDWRLKNLEYIEFLNYEQLVEFKLAFVFSKIF